MILNICLCLAAAIIVITAIYITAIEPYWFKTIYMNIVSDRIPDDFNGKKMLFLTDIHTSKFGRLEKTLISRIKQIGKVDICVITGDLMLNQKCGGALSEVIKSIDAENGIYYVCGNSEYKPYVDHEEMIKVYEDIGLINLDNKAKIFNSSAVLVGIDNFEECVKADTKKAFENVSGNMFSVCLCHSPSFVDDLIPYEPNIVLCGHTHGGQVKLPIFNIVYTHMDKNNNINDGIYDAEKLTKLLNVPVKRTKLIVSKGIGTSAIRIRFRCRPELYVLTFGNTEKNI